MAKGQTGQEPKTFVPAGLKVRTAAPDVAPDVAPSVAPSVSQPVLATIPVAPSPSAEPVSDLARALNYNAIATNSERDSAPYAPRGLSRRSTDRVSDLPQGQKAGFRPMPILTILSLICLGILCALGQWQWDKYVLKSKAPTAVTAIEPTAVAAALEASVPEYRPVIVEGLIDPRTIKVSVVQGGVRGFRLFSPVVMEAGGIFVDRGFVTEEDVTKLVAPSGQVRLLGVLRTGAKANRYTPDNEPASDVWYWPDLTAMADMLVIQTSSAQYYVAQSDVDPLLTGTSSPNPYADSKGTNQVSAGTHLGYALQWWGFGLALIGVYIGLHVRNGRLRFRDAKPS